MPPPRVVAGVARHARDAVGLLATTSRRRGGDGPGFPEGTRTRFVWRVAVNGPNATGVYPIGRLDGVPAEQYGLMSLAARR
jgi:hypothetical protein